MERLTEVPETPKLRCPQNPNHKLFTVGKKRTERVDEYERPVTPGTGPGATCTECGSTARVRQQLNG